MKKNTILFFLIISLFFIPSKSLSKTLTSKEDIEIKKLKEQIKILENRISQLEEIKKNNSPVRDLIYLSLDESFNNYFML